MPPLGLSKRPTDLATKQAAASVGQVALVNAWSAAFGRFGRTVGQVLLTADDVARPLSQQVAALEQRALAAALAATQGNKQAAARRLLT